jgi:hypothetical protein
LLSHSSPVKLIDRPVIGLEALTIVFYKDPAAAGSFFAATLPTA